MAYASNPVAPAMTDTFWKEAVFTVPKGVNPLSLTYEYQVRRDINKWIAKRQREGWTLVSKPIIEKVAVISDAAPLGSPGIHEGNPLREPDKDLYRVMALFKRRPIPGRLVIPDSMLNHIPPGFKIVG